MTQVKDHALDIVMARWANVMVSLQLEEAIARPRRRIKLKIAMVDNLDRLWITVFWTYVGVAVMDAFGLPV